MLGLNAAFVPRCTNLARRTTLQAQGRDAFSPPQPPSDRIRPSSTVSIKRPDPYVTDRVQRHPLESPMSAMAVMRPRLLQGVNKQEARKLLEALDDILETPLLHSEVIELSEVLGLIVSRSPMVPADIEFPSIINRLTEAVNDQLAEFSSADLCRLMWSYGCFGPSVLQQGFPGVKSLVYQICLRLETDYAPTLPMTVLLFHGLERMKLQGQAALTHQILRRLGPTLKHPGVEMDDMAKLVALAGKLRVENGHQFLRQAGRVAKHRLHEFSDNGLRDFVQGFVYYDITILPHLFDVLTAEIRVRGYEIPISTLIDITLGIAKLQYLQEDRYKAFFESRVSKSESELTPKDVSNCLQAMGMSNTRSQMLIERLKSRFIDRCSQMKTIDVCNSLLGLTRLHALDETSLKTGLCFVRKGLNYGVSKMQRLMLHQILTHAQLFLKIDTIPEGIFPKVWQSACRDAWIKDQVRSRYNPEASMLKIVRSLGLEWREEASRIGDIRILVIDAPEGFQPVVLDVLYRKKHCFVNQRKQPEPLPWKQWQWSVLREQGYTVVSLKEEEWMQVPRESRFRHLGMKLGFWNVQEIRHMENTQKTKNQEYSQ